MVSPGHDAVVDRFCADLADAVDRHGAGRDTMHVYGGVAGDDGAGPARVSLTAPAAVLVGGASRRMGRDKATLILGDGSILGRRAVEALSAGCDGIDGDVAVIGGDRRGGRARSARGGSPTRCRRSGRSAGCSPRWRTPSSVAATPSWSSRAISRVVTAEHVEALVTAARPWVSSVVIAEVDGRAAYPIGVWPTAATASIAAALHGGAGRFRHRPRGPPGIDHGGDARRLSRRRRTGGSVGPWPSLRIMAHSEIDVDELARRLDDGATLARRPPTRRVRGGPHRRCRCSSRSPSCPTG